MIGNVLFIILICIGLYVIFKNKKGEIADE